MIRGVKGMAASVKTMNKKIPLSADDREYVERCVSALELYNQGVDIEGRWVRSRTFFNLRVFIKE